MKKLSYSIIALLLSAGIVCFAVKFTAGQTADAEVPNVEKKSPVGKLVSTDKNPLLLVKVPQDVANLLTLFHVINAVQTNDRIICCHTHHDVGMINGQTLSVYSLIGAKGHWNKVLFLAEPTQ